MTSETRSIRRAAIAGGALLSLAAMAMPLAAQEQDPYEACSVIADAGERLICFDATFAQMKATRVAREEAREARRAEEFGLTATQREQLDEQRTEEAAELAARGDTVGAAAVAPQTDDYSVVAEVAEVFSDGEGRQVIVLDNGQIWREKSNSSIRRGVRAGDTVTISDDRFGLFLRAEGRSGRMSVGRMR